MRLWILSIFLVVSNLSVVLSAVINVPGDEATIQAAIDVAVTGDTVLVMDGTYTGAGNRDIDFGGKGVTLVSQHGADTCVIDCQGFPGNDFRGFYLHGSYTSSAVIYGLTVTGGYISDDPEGGGAILVSGDGSAVDIRECRFLSNYTAFDGGAIRVIGADCRVDIRDNFFSFNSADNDGGALSISSSGTEQPRVFSCDFQENTAAGDGGGINFLGNVGLFHCRITGNSAMNGGGVFIDAESGSVMGNCVISDNQAVQKGGGAGLSGGLSGTPVSIQNCTLVGNAGDSGGGVSIANGADIEITDSIMWNNAADTAGPEIHLGSTGDPSILNVVFSDVQGGASAVHTDPGSTLNWGISNFDADPLFTSGYCGGYYLSQLASGQAADSPCFDSGSQTAEGICYPSAPGGETVCLNELSTRTDHIADMGKVDLGYHCSIGIVITPTPTPATHWGDTCDTAGDITGLLSAAWGSGVPWCDPVLIQGNTDDYDENCTDPCGGMSDGIDLVWQFTPPELWYFDINNCDAGNDWSIIVWSGSCTGSVVTCDDDSCGSACGSPFSFQTGCTLFVPGTTYYVAVWPFSFSTETTVCFVPCPDPPTPTLTPTPVCIHDGDLNQDGSITAGDAQTAFAIVMGTYDPDFEESCRANCNGDGAITAGDAQMIFITALGMGECVDPL